MNFDSTCGNASESGAPLAAQTPSGWNARLNRLQNISASVSVALDKPAYDRLMGHIDNAVSVTVEQRLHDPRPRCLWGGRARHIQIGTPEDSDRLTTITVPRAHFEASHS